MTRSQANRIEEILRNQDVRDPRLTLDAIAAILAENPSIKPEPRPENDEALSKLLSKIHAEVTKNIEEPEQSEPEASFFAKLMADLLTMQVEGEDDPAEIPHLVPGDVQNEFGDPVATIRIYNTKPRPGKLNVCVAIDCCDTHIEPRHFVALKEAIKDFSKAKVERMRQEAGQ
jgi:hypothetical protein